MKRHPRNNRSNSEPVTINGLKVDVRNNDINYALRKFKKKVQEDGRLQEYKDRQEYLKPSERKKRELSAARARHLRKVAKEQNFGEKKY